MEIWVKEFIEAWHKIMELAEYIRISEKDIDDAIKILGCEIDG